MSNKIIDSYELWMRIEDRNLNTIEVQIALATFAKEYSKADSTIINDFTLFKSYKTYNKKLYN